MGDLKWMMMFALLGIGSKSAAQSDITVSVFSVTSRSVIVRWTRYPGAASYKITVTPKNSPSEPSAFAQFSANSVMGSVNSLSPTILYTIQVEAIDGSMAVLSQAEIETTTSPEVPTINMATSKQSESITVTFTTVTGATSYILRTETADGSFFSETEVSSSPGTVYNLQPYTGYTLSVLSINSGGRSQPSRPVEAKTMVTAPDLNAMAPDNATIVVGWEPVDHAVLYTLSIIQQGSDSRVRRNTTDTNVTFTSLEAGTTYCIKAYAWDPENRPGDNFDLCQITRPATPGSIELSVTQDSAAGLSVSWGSVQGAAEYLVQSSEGLNCTSTHPNCTLAPVECGKRHTVTVTAINQAGPSHPSAPEEFITFPCPPEPLWLEESEAGNCSVMWGAMPGADSYMAFIKRDDGSEDMCNTTSTSCTYHCQCGYTYLTEVFAYNQAGSSLQGQILNYTTLPCCPDDVYISLVSTDTLEIMWSAVRGAEVYETRAVEGSEVILCNDTSPVCALSDLTCNSPYSVVVTPCNDIRGCNRTCRPHTKETAPCMPEILSVSQTNGTCVMVTWTTPNTAAHYIVSVKGEKDTHTCQSNGSSCDIYHLPCGSSYEVSVIATTAVGQSLPSYTVPLETAPCCPANLSVDQVTQSMTNVTWSPARGAQSYVTSLTSAKGDARCHTLDTHCLMGCITCGANYTVSMEAISRTGHKAECTYHGFSSSACCPSGVKLYRMANNTLRVYWRSASSSLHNYTADVFNSTSNHTCTAPPGGNTCDVSEIMCGDMYTVVVAPLTMEGTMVQFCPQRMYSVSCSGSDIGMVTYRRKRSVD